MIEIAGGILLAFLAVVFAPVALWLGYWLMIGAAIGLGVAVLVWIPTEWFPLMALAGFVVWFIVLRSGK